MIDARKIEVRSIEELIAALHPIRSAEFDDDATIPRLRAIKRNISAVLSFTLYPADESVSKHPEYREIVDDIRRQCLMINGLVSRMMFRQRWLFATSPIEELREVTLRYEGIARAACRICFFTSPNLRNALLKSF